MALLMVHWSMALLMVHWSMALLMVHWSMALLMVHWSMALLWCTGLWPCYGALVYGLVNGALVYGLVNGALVYGLVMVHWSISISIKETIDVFLSKQQRRMKHAFISDDATETSDY